jgi:hypothetical protein
MDKNLENFLVALLLKIISHHSNKPQGAVTKSHLEKGTVV